MSCLSFGLALVRPLSNQDASRLLRDILIGLLVIYYLSVEPALSIHIPKLTINLPCKLNYMLMCDL